MSRSVPWRRTVSDACNWHQSQALDSTLYILRQTGPTGFLLKEEGERKTVKVFLGDPHTCTCPVFKKERDLCKHICWLLLRKFRLSVNDPLSWQLGLVEREVNEILRGRVTADERRAKQHQNNKKVDTVDGRTVVQQRDIADDDVCPICQEELLEKKLPVTYCKFGCGNSVHIKCMKVWAEHQQKTSQEGTIKCPMCREDFGPIDLLKTEMRNAGCSAAPAPGIRMDRHIGICCSHCGIAPIEGKCYRCTVCPTFMMCQRCFNLPVHTNHSFQFRHKRNQRWRSALRTLGSSLPPALVNDLMHREISENDYDVLLQLERNSQEELSSLSEDSLNSLPIERVREGGPLTAPGSQCRICLRGYTPGQQVRKLPCKHRFHKDCIDSWLLHSHPTCPVDGIVAVSNQPASPVSQRTLSSTRPSGQTNVNVEAVVPESRDLTLTALGIPIAASRLSESTSVGRNQVRKHVQRPRQSLLSSTGLELSGTRVGGGDTAGFDSHPEDVAEMVPGNRLLHQATQHRDRISQRLRAMERQVAAASEANQLLTPGALIQFLQSDSLVSALDDGALVNSRRSSAGSAGSAISIASDSGPRRGNVRQVVHGRGRPQGPRSLLRQRSNSLERAVPSIQSVRQELGDLFLGNNPSVQPPVTEHVTSQRPPVVPRSRPRMFTSVFQKHASSLARAGGPVNANIRLEGSALEYNTQNTED